MKRIVVAGGITLALILAGGPAMATESPQPTGPDSVACEDAQAAVAANRADRTAADERATKAQKEADEADASATRKEKAAAEADTSAAKKDQAAKDSDDNATQDQAAAAEAEANGNLEERDRYRDDAKTARENRDRFRNEAQQARDNRDRFRGEAEAARINRDEARAEAEAARAERDGLDAAFPGLQDAAEKACAEPDDGNDGTPPPDGNHGDNDNGDNDGDNRTDGDDKNDAVVPVDNKTDTLGTDAMTNDDSKVIVEDVAAEQNQLAQTGVGGLGWMIPLGGLLIAAGIGTVLLPRLRRS